VLYPLLSSVFICVIERLKKRRDRASSTIPCPTKTGLTHSTKETGFFTLIESLNEVFCMKNPVSLSVLNKRDLLTLYQPHLMG
jgi:hypothetical protein